MYNTADASEFKHFTTTTNPTWDKFSVEGNWKYGKTSDNSIPPDYWNPKRKYAPDGSPVIPDYPYPGIPDYPIYPYYPPFDRQPYFRPTTDKTNDIENTLKKWEEIQELIKEEKEKKMRTVTDYLDEVSPMKYVIVAVGSGYYVGGNNFKTVTKDEAWVFDTVKHAALYGARNTKELAYLNNWYVRGINRHGEIDIRKYETLAYDLLTEFNEDIKTAIV